MSLFKKHACDGVQINYTRARLFNGPDLLTLNQSTEDVAVDFVIDLDRRSALVLEGDQVSLSDLPPTEGELITRRSVTLPSDSGKWEETVGGNGEEGARKGSRARLLVDWIRRQVCVLFQREGGGAPVGDPTYCITSLRFDTQTHNTSDYGRRPRSLFYSHLPDIHDPIFRTNMPIQAADTHLVVSKSPGEHDGSDAMEVWKRAMERVRLEQAATEVDDIEPADDSDDPYGVPTDDSNPWSAWEDVDEGHQAATLGVASPATVLRAETAHDFGETSTKHSNQNNQETGPSKSNNDIGEGDGVKKAEAGSVQHPGAGGAVVQQSVGEAGVMMNPMADPSLSMMGVGGGFGGLGLGGMLPMGGMYGYGGALGGLGDLYGPGMGYGAGLGYGLDGLGNRLGLAPNASAAAGATVGAAGGGVDADFGDDENQFDVGVRSFVPGMCALIATAWCPCARGGAGRD